MLSSTRSANLDTKSWISQFRANSALASTLSANFQIKNGIRKLPSFFYVSGKFQLNRTQNRRDISV